MEDPPVATAVVVGTVVVSGPEVRVTRRVPLAPAVGAGRPARAAPAVLAVPRVQEVPRVRAARGVLQVRAVHEERRGVRAVPEVPRGREAPRVRAARGVLQVRTVHEDPEPRGVRAVPEVPRGRDARGARAVLEVLPPRDARWAREVPPVPGVLRHRRAAREVRKDRAIRERTRIPGRAVARPGAAARPGGVDRPAGAALPGGALPPRPEDHPEVRGRARAGSLAPGKAVAAWTCRGPEDRAGAGTLQPSTRARRERPRAGVRRGVAAVNGMNRRRGVVGAGRVAGRVRAAEVTGAAVPRLDARLADPAPHALSAASRLRRLCRRSYACRPSSHVPGSLRGVPARI
jgi:hypothetical protein